MLIVVSSLGGDGIYIDVASGNIFILSDYVQAAHYTLVHHSVDLALTTHNRSILRVCQ